MVMKVSRASISPLQCASVSEADFVTTSRSHAWKRSHGCEATTLASRVGCRLAAAAGGKFWSGTTSCCRVVGGQALTVASFDISSGPVRHSQLSPARHWSLGCFVSTLIVQIVC